MTSVQRTSVQKGSRWVVTVFLHVFDEGVDPFEYLESLVGDDKPLRYLAYGEEVCPNTGTPHLQAFCQLWENRAASYVHNIFPRCHVSLMRGTFQQNDAYCSKEGTLVEFGTRVEQGMRTDIIAVKRKLDDGMAPMAIAEENVAQFCAVSKMPRFCAEYSHYVRGKMIKTDRSQPKVYIRIGDPGTGKTRWLDEQFGLDGWARMPDPNGTWWITESVSRSDTVLIDELGPKKAPKIEEFLEWTDRYPIEFHTKGGFLWWKPKNIVITSNFEVKDWWNDISEVHMQAVMRRVYRIERVYKDRPSEVLYQNEEYQEDPPHPQDGAQVSEEEQESALREAND